MRPSSTSAALAALACAVVVLASACTEDPDAVTAPPSTTAVTASTTAPTSASTSTSPSTSTSTTTTEPPTPRALVAATWPAESDDTGPDLDADPSVRIAELAPGDCVLLDELVAAGDGQVESVEVVECAVPHDAEIYAVVSLDDDPDSDHPGDEVVVGAADQVCLDAFDPYVGAPYVETRLEIVHLRPTSASWARGDRRVICGVVNVSSAPLEGSVAGRGSGAP